MAREEVTQRSLTTMLFRSTASHPFTLFLLGEQSQAPIYTHPLDPCPEGQTLGRLWGLCITSSLLLLLLVNLCLKYVANQDLSSPSLLSSFPAKSIHSDCHSTCQQCSWLYREWRYLQFVFFYFCLFVRFFYHVCAFLEGLFLWYFI